MFYKHLCRNHKDDTHHNNSYSKQAEKIHCSLTFSYLLMIRVVIHLLSIFDLMMWLNFNRIHFLCTVRMSASPTGAAMARIVQGTKLLTNGGSEKLFQHTFGVFPGEKLLKQYACYISTTSGPVIGTIYITTKRLAFCSDYPLCHHPFSLQLQHQCTYYKVLPDLIASVSTISSNWRLR